MRLALRVDVVGRIPDDLQGPGVEVFLVEEIGQEVGIGPGKEPKSVGLPQGPGDGPFSIGVDLDELEDFRDKMLMEVGKRGDKDASLGQEDVADGIGMVEVIAPFPFRGLQLKGKASKPDPPSNRQKRLRSDAVGRFFVKEKEIEGDHAGLVETKDDILMGKVLPIEGRVGKSFAFLGKLELQEGIEGERREGDAPVEVGEGKGCGIEEDFVERVEVEGRDGEDLVVEPSFDLLQGSGGKEGGILIEGIVLAKRDDHRSFVHVAFESLGHRRLDASRKKEGEADGEEGEDEARKDDDQEGSLVEEALDHGFPERKTREAFPLIGRNYLCSDVMRCLFDMNLSVR